MLGNIFALDEIRQGKKTNERWLVRIARAYALTAPAMTHGCVLQIHKD